MALGKLPRLLSTVSVLLAGLLLAGAAHADTCGTPDTFGENCFIINGQTESDTFILPDAFDTLVLQSGGAVNIPAAGGRGIVMNDDYQIVNIEAGGAVSTVDANGYGVHAVEEFAEINNAGSIATSGNAAHGIFEDNFGTTSAPVIIIINSGSITTTGPASNGIHTTGDFAVITNTGQISAQGIGILAAGDYAIVVNSGAVSGGAGSNAIDLTGDFATLTLLAGTSLQGGIQFSTDLNNTLILGPGLSAVLTVVGTYTLVTNGAFVQDGNQLAVVDTSGFSAHDEMLLDLTGIIATAVGNRLEGARQGVSTQSAAVNGMRVIPVAESHADAVAWASGLGSWREESAAGADAGFALLQGGVVAGLDGAVGPGGRAGIFAGGAVAEVERQDSDSKLDAQSWFAGLYASARGDRGGFVEAALAGGVSQFDTARSVISNMGTQRAEADYTGVFIAPTAKIGTELQMYSGNTVTPSLRARYAGLWLEGYREQGTSAPLSVAARDIHIFELRAELAVAGTAESAGGVWRNTLRLGAEGAAAEGDAVEATLLALPLSFDPNDENITGRGFAGFDSLFTTLGGMSLALGAEAGFDFDESFVLKAAAGLYVPL